VRRSGNCPELRRSDLALLSDPLVGAVRLGDQLEVMPRGVVEVDTPSAVVGVDLARCVTRTGPKSKATSCDALNGAVEHVVGNEERIVPAGKLSTGLGVIEPDPVVEREAEKRSPARGFRESEQILQERRRLLLVLGGNSQVIEVNGHIALPFAHLHTAWLYVLKGPGYIAPRRYPHAEASSS
jgi:hypothetical protein